MAKNELRPTKVLHPSGETREYKLRFDQPAPQVGDLAVVFTEEASGRWVLNGNHVLSLAEAESGVAARGKLGMKCAVGRIVADGAPAEASASADVEPAPVAEPSIELIPLARTVSSPTNPRQHFDETSIEELAASVRQIGLLQPITVRPGLFHFPPAAGLFQGFEIVAGERRFRAARLAGLERIPAIVRSMSDTDVLEAQIVENGQRQDVTPLEEADAFQRAVDARMYGEDPREAAAEIALRIGKSAEYVRHRLSLSRLIPRGRDLLDSGFLGLGHALALAPLSDEDQLEVLSAIADETALMNGGVVKVQAATARMTLSETRQYIRERLARRLGEALFDTNDPTLNPERGACPDCPYRSGAGGLFPSETFGGEVHGKEGTERCLKPACYTLKTEVHLARKAESFAARLQGQEAPIASAGVTAPPIVTRSLPDSGWTFVTEDEALPGDVPAVLSSNHHSGRKAGEEVWMRPPAENDDDYVARRRAQQERWDRERRVRQLAVAEAASLMSAPHDEYEVFIQLALRDLERVTNREVRKGIRTILDIPGEGDLFTIGELRKMHRDDVHRLAAVAVMVQESQAQIWRDEYPSIEATKALAAAFSVGWTEAYRSAEAIDKMKQKGKKTAEAVPA